MKKIILFIASGILGHVLIAQSSAPDVLASGGGFASGAGFTNSFTIGQGSITGTFTSGTFILTQGFQQPTSIGTGMVPVNESETLGLFPNPSNGQFFLEYTLSENADISIEAVNVLGQIVYSEKSSGYAGKQLFQVNLSSNANGVYVIRCTIKSLSETTTHTSKITLTR